MPYHEISIERPSPQQARKLVRGLPVRVKVGHGASIHVSPEQHKKMMKAHSLGKAHTLTMDPFQAEQHGSGLMGDLARASVKYVKGIAKANIPQAERFVRKEIQKHGMAGKRIAEEKLTSLGVSPELSHMIAEEATGHMVRGAEHLAHRGFHHADRMLGEGVHHPRASHHRKRGGKLPSVKSLGKTISKGLKQVGKELKPVARAVEPVAKSVGQELLKLGKEHGREALHLAVNEGVAPAMLALSAYTGQPEIMAAAPLVKKVANSAVDDLGDKYGFGVIGGRKGRRRVYGPMVGSALYPA